ncbi:MAG: class I SAM-dependent methyltransferase [Candidatus Krumholzibacteriota bacterium]|nr:class I SAM-dependent methyltransferase [Candidatus Krumholzibacteriota bacterium]
MSALARLVSRFDRLFPPPRVGGRESAAAYSAWEYDVGRDLLDRYGGLFGDLAGREVLDIGCGLGGKTVVYAEVGASVTGVDVEPSHVAQSVRWAREHGSRARFAAGDAERLPFADDTFDLVVANDSMEHFPRPEAALPELARVARPGGSVFLFFTPWGSPLGSHLYDWIRTPWCHLLYSEKLLEELLEIALARRGAEAPRKTAAELMRRYRLENNRITVRRWRRILRGVDSLETVIEELRPPKFRRLASLARIPLVGELFTGTVVAVLRKKGERPFRRLS